MKPADLAKSGTESGHQRAVLAWAAIAMQHGFDVARSWAFDGECVKDAVEHYGSTPVPELRWLHHIPNGGSRGDDARSRAIRGASLKAEGVKTGVSDLSLPVKRGLYSGLYVEMKKPGKLSSESAEQKEFGAFVKSQGFGYVCVDSWQEATKNIEGFLTHAPAN